MAQIGLPLNEALVTIFNKTRLPFGVIDLDQAASRPSISPQLPAMKAPSSGVA
jgi:hypothetical protein